MKISVIHPSRGRPEQAHRTFRKWFYSADNRYLNFEYLLSVDNDDPSIYHDDLWKIFRNSNKSAIEAINNVAPFCNGDLIIVVSDDFDCPDHWDTLLLNEIKGKSDFVVKTVDGLQQLLVTLPIVDRVWYERYGYIYHPDYIHMACDVELTAVAAMTGKLIKSNLVFKHLHYSAGLSPKDHINEKNDTTYAHGDMILAQHRANNFGIVNPVMRYEDIVWH